MKYTLIRSRRQTCAIIIRDKEVLVRAPFDMPKHDIDRFVADKTDWIHTKLSAIDAYHQAQSVFSLNYGDTVRYRGAMLRIVARPGDRAGLSDEGFYMPPGLSPEQIQRVCAEIYRLCARQVLTEKALAFAKIMGVSPAAVKVNSARTKWGSCSGKKNLNFSWRLLMADDPVIDYVVVHELAHLTHMNHSADFWQGVEHILPNYHTHEHALITLQEQLRSENW